MPSVKKFSRYQSSQSTKSDDQTPSVATIIVQPKHAHIPSIPNEGELAFALFIFFFNISSMGLQYVHLYKTNWWLPYSYHEYAINFQLIDTHLVGYLIAMVFLPFLISLFKQISSIENKCCLFLGYAFFTILTAAWFSYFAFMSYHTYRKTSMLYIILLLYPCITYGVVYYGHLPSHLLKKLRPKSSTLNGLTHKLVNHMVYHNCSNDPEKIREETEYLKHDFNQRLKTILFSTLFSTFHAAFVPLMFVQMESAYCTDNCWNTVYFEPGFCGCHVAVTAISAFLFFSQHYLPPHYIDNLHRCALHLGSWLRVEGRGSPQATYVPWSELQVWQQGALVKHVKGLFCAEGINNSAEPGSLMHTRFFRLFYKPMRVIDFLQCVISLVLLTQFLVLIQVFEWYKILSCAVMMFFNFVTLYKITRNRLVLKRCYQPLAEHDNSD